MREIDGVKLEEHLIPTKLKRLLVGPERYNLEKIVHGKDNEQLLEDVGREELVLYIKKLFDDYFDSVAGDDGKIEGLPSEYSKHATEKALEQIAKSKCPQFVPMTDYTLLVTEA